MNSLKITLGFFIVWMLAACADAPTQEMSDARFALRAAEQAGAANHAAESLAQAAQTMASAEQYLQSGSYISARNHAIQAREQASKTRLMALVIAQAKTAIDNAARFNALVPAAVEAFKSAQEAARQNNSQRTIAEAGRAEKLANAGANEAYLKEAKRILVDCAPENRQTYAELFRQAREALAGSFGKEAFDYARQACGKD